MSLPIDLILYIIIAVVLGIWLKNTLGTRHGEERERPNPFDPANRPQESKSEQRPLPHLDIPDSALRPVTSNVQAEELPRNSSKSEDIGTDKIAALQRLDPSFTLPVFIRNAQDAYAIILESYAEGDEEALATLTTPAILLQFKALITERQAQKVTLAIEVQGVRACHVAALRITGAVAEFDLEIVADALMQEQDATGKYRSGHADKVTELRDKWTFMRNMAQKDPTWRVSIIHDEIGS